MKKNLFLFFCFFGFLTKSKATILNVPFQYSTIQSALNVAASGDTILVQPGVYFESILWTDVNGIKLISAGDSSNTIIDGNNMGRVITITPSTALIDINTVIKGFLSNPLLENVVISNNISKVMGYWNYGGGIYCEESTLVLTDVTIKDNILTTLAPGGWFLSEGILGNMSNLTLTNVQIIGNKLLGYGLGFHAGAGIYLFQDYTTLTNVLIASNLTYGNTFWKNGGGIYGENSTLFFNDNSTSEIMLYGSTLNAEYSDN